MCGFIDGEQKSVHFYLNFGCLVFFFMGSLSGVNGIWGIGYLVS